MVFFCAFFRVQFQTRRPVQSMIYGQLSLYNLYYIWLEVTSWSLITGMGTGNVAFPFISWLHPCNKSMKLLGHNGVEFRVFSYVSSFLAGRSVDCIRCYILSSFLNLVIKLLLHWRRTLFVCSMSSKLWLTRSICSYVNMLSLLPITDPFDDGLLICTFTVINLSLCRTTVQIL